MRSARAVGIGPRGELDPKYPQGSADLVFNVDLFDLQRPSVREQYSDHLIDLALHVDDRVPADAHAMGDRPGVVPIIFDGLGDRAKPTREASQCLKIAQRTKVKNFL